MMIANPTAASAAATAITKNTNSCPTDWPRKDEKATNVRFAEFNISSTDMNTIIALRRINTPVTPTININALSIK